MKKTIFTIAGILAFTVNFACTKNTGATDDTLTSQEKQSLAFMREEEKLAYDIYVKMFDKWGLLPFQNIQQSESRHMAAIKTLLDKYLVPDPSANKSAGEFENPLISELYTMLLAKGDSSGVQALLAGAAIEEIDIRDLKLQVQLTGRPDIIAVYQELMRGSRNHLRAFVSNLAARGITYSPQYLSAAEFDEIINSPMERGGGNHNRQ